MYVATAWASLLSSVVISLVLWALLANHQGTRGERPPEILLLDIGLLLISALGCLAGLFSLVGVRSWRDAMIIVPAALLGIGVSGCNLFVSLMSYLLEGRNLGG